MTWFEQGVQNIVCAQLLTTYDLMYKQKTKFAICHAGKNIAGKIVGFNL